MTKPIKYEITDQTMEIPHTPGFIQRISEDGRVLTLHRTNIRMYELEDLEKTFRAIKDDCSPEELDYVLNETDDFYSDRRAHLRNRTYSENGHMYPPLKKINVKNFRSNARRS
jgi:hypothetical protein